MDIRGGTRLGSLGMALTLALAAAGCDDGGGGTSCPPGTEGCACQEGARCEAGLRCQEDLCVACPTGSAGCACFGNGTCDADHVCDAGTCVSCPSGSTGCPCFGNGTCGDELRCVDGACESCPSGSEGCACGAGDACDGELICDQGVCVVDSCPAGEAGCPCLLDGSCGDALRCEGGSCVSCPEGSEGCACGTGDTCDDGLICEEGSCEPLGCTPGALGCVCDADDACDGRDVFCDTDGLCKLDPCPAGLEGCPCAEGDACGHNDRGEALTCDNGTCVAASCTPGDTGCVCIDGTDCTEPTDECADGFCQPAGCVAGELNCPCADGACAPGLTCRDGAICVDSSGYTGGPCFADGTCRSGNRCSNDVCVPCTLGTLDCACDDQGACMPGLECKDELCEEYVGQQVPDQPRCYTPCERDLVLDDGTYRQCPADGLMEGCVGGLECIDGTCAEAGGEPRGCEADIDCPDFQACIQGRCYANCEDDTECGDGLSCKDHACRVPCSANANDCEDGYACVTDDGEFGHCLPVADPEGEPQRSVDGSFRLSKTVLEFSNVNTTEKVRLVNDSPAFETFRVRKRSHVGYFDDGTSERYDDPDDGVDCDPAQDCPLFWIEMGEDGSATRVQEFEVGVDGGGEITLDIAGAGGFAGVRWDGLLEVIHPRLGVQTITLGYSERPEGRWAGNIYYFAQFGDYKLDEWLADPVGTPVTQVGNAFVQRWAAFRSGNISYDELLAVISATRTESWRWPSVTGGCEGEYGKTSACYMYDINQLGLVEYTEDVESVPIPTGVTELPFAVNLRIPDAAASPGLMEGRIESTRALQYAGEPSFTLDFGSDPAGCDSTLGGACKVFIQSLDAQVFVGGRYETTGSDADCLARAGDGYQLTQIPWLLPGFQRATEVDDSTGLRYRFECRDSQLPFNDGSDPLPDDMLAANASLAISNPIPDGRTRRRTMELIDGALINQSLMVVIFKETFNGFVPGEEGSFSAYGFMVLERRRVDLDDADDDGDSVPDVYEGSLPDDQRIEPEGLLDVACSPDLVEELLGWGNTEVTSDNASEVVVGLIDGIVPSGSTSYIGDGSIEGVHYLCVETGLFDGGRGASTDIYAGATPPNTDNCDTGAEDDFYADNGSCDDGGPDSDAAICPLGTDKTDCGNRSAGDEDPRVACPAGSEVIYFTVDASVKDQAAIAAEPCQEDGTCQDTLNEWIAAGTPIMQYKPAYRCGYFDGAGDPVLETKVYCDADRLDLRKGKLFLEYTEEEAVFTPLYAEIDSAFRYKTQFRSRTGKTIGFAPQICVPNSNQIPYCYDPPSIEAARERVDCLLHVWRDHYDDLDATSGGARNKLEEFLCTNYSYTEACHQGMDPNVVHDGFERLYAELLVMMGDESYTRAFASRFDLAGSNAVSFEGTLFEPGGINLSGAAGYEMYSLYQAAQYYQEALDRFYSMSPLMWESLEFGFDAQNFVTPETVTWYFDRLIRASTQKARAWSAVARRYQNFNRPDLARSVVERTYTATYVESVVIGRLMLVISDKLKSEDKPQVLAVLEDGQRRYRMAMLDMRSLYESITDNINFFGLPPDYIPFPTLNNREDNAFEVILGRAKTKMNVAAQREDEALTRGRSFETDAEEFQAELVRLRNTYENQLGDVCGTMQGTDGRIYPAVERYAYLNERAAEFGDPCGLVGNGQISTAMGQFEIAQIDLQRIRTSMDNVLSEVEIERSRAEAQCNRVIDLADYVYEQQGDINDIQSDVRWMQFGISRIDRTLQATQTIAELTKCSVGTSTDCPMAGVALGIFVGAKIAGEIGIGVLEGLIADKEDEIADLERDTAKFQTLTECDSAIIESNARMATILLRMKELQLEALRAEYQVRLNISEIQRQFNLAKRLEQELREAEQFAINVQAAKNDPNVRIYRNDAYINADISFEDAMREAYRATKVFEYYTSQSYAEMEKLFLIRMVQFGDYNLQNYLIDLENSFYEFEENYGVPDTRVAIVSLRDDVLRIPRTAEDGTARSQADRIGEMRERLGDAALLDENGYLTIPFATNFDALSPLTRNHKLLYIEAEMIGSDVGDTLGRVYLRQQGTSVVNGVTGGKQYFRFPDRIAVINPFFNGNRVFTQEIYRNYRLRDRPYVNTSWELALNQRDELVNKDVNLQSLTDIRVYLYYTDFTEF